MPLSNLEQLQIISGNVGPDSTTLDALVHQSAFNFAATFYTTYNQAALSGNIVDGELVYDNPPAAAYANKMLNVSSQVFRASGTDIQRLTRIMVVLIGGAVNNIGIVEGATDAQWDTFVGAQIDECFELFSGVRQDEKAAYLAL